MMSIDRLISELHWCSIAVSKLRLDNPDDRFVAAEVQQRLDTLAHEFKHLPVPSIQRRLIRDDEMTITQAKMYIRKVLTNWPAFCHGHPRFAKALRILLDARTHE